MIASPSRYSIVCVAILGGLAWLALQGAGLGLLPALLLLPLVAWPAWVALAYPAAVGKAQARAVLREGEAPWWGAFLGGALLRQALAVPVALLAAWSVGWWLVAEGMRGLLWIGASAVLLYPVARLLARQTGPLKPFARLCPVMVGAPVVVAAGLTAAWALVAGLDALEGTLAERVASELRYEGSSALMAWAVDGMAVLNGARAWGLDWTEGRVGWLATFWRLGAAFGQFWLVAGVFAACLLPAGEGRRILRASDTDTAPPVGARRAALAGFLLALVSAALVTAAAEGEAWASQRRTPEALAEAPGLLPPGGGSEGPSLASAAGPTPVRVVPRLPTPTALRAAIEAERLGDLACPRGTITAVSQLDGEVRAVLAAQRAAVEGAARQGFGAMRGNIGGYLDWYYSLPAEYARTGHLLAGDAEDYLETQFRGHMESGAPLEPLQAAVEGLSGNTALLADWQGEREALLGACEAALLPSDEGVLVTLASAPEALLLAGPSVEALDLQARVGGATAAGAAGGLAGALVGKAAGKLVAKEAFGLAVEALGKLALGKAAGWLGGAAAGAGGGALVGSVVPGLGTTVGAAVGGVVGGLGTWIATDYVLLGLEEALSREHFEAEILTAIDEAEAEFLASLATQ